METLCADVSMEQTRCVDRSLAPDGTRPHLGFLHEEDPGWRASEALFDDFLAGALSSADGAPLELAGHAARACYQQTVVLRRLVECRRAPRTKAVAASLHEELFTWRLLSELYEDRLLLQPKEMLNMDEMTDDEQLPPIDDRSAHEYLRATDKEYREMDIVLRWLQTNAADLFDEASVHERFANTTTMWRDSVVRLQKGDPAGIRSFHPDAPLEGRLLAEDEETEQKLLLVLLQYVRCGQLTKAADLCVHCGQAWRAAQLCAMELYDDPNGPDENDENECDEQMRPPVRGNRARRYTKAIMWAASEQPGLSAVERALYGALSGRLSAVLPVCRNAADRLWAYVLCAMEHRLEQRLRRVHDVWQRDGPNAEYEQLPGCADDQADFTLADILQELAAHDSASSGDIVNRSMETGDDVSGGQLTDGPMGFGGRRRQSADVADPYERLRQHAMLDEPDALAAFAARFIRSGDGTAGATAGDDDVHSAGRHFVRCAAHVILLLRRIHAPISEENATVVISEYVKHLIEDRRLELAPYYISELPADLRVSHLAALFARASGDAAERTGVLRAAESAGLDVRAGAVRCVLDARATHDRDADLESESALLLHFDWLFIDDSLLIDVLRQGDAIVTHLLQRERVESARAVFDRLSATAAVDAVRRRWGDDEDRVPPADANALKRWLGYDAYFAARCAYDVWRVATDASALPTFDADTDTETEEQDMDHERRQRLAEVRRRRDQLLADKERRVSLAAQEATAAFQKVLLFPAGFLVDVAEEPADEADAWTSADRVSAVRSALAFETAAMYASVLAHSQQYNLCLRLADLLASVRLALHKMFTTEQLGALMTMLADCALQALDDGIDPCQPAVSGHTS